ncbi:TonB-dependent receptor [Psychrobacter sp. HD31]|uniref:TonB-dependent receptor domain-containing protein n=1 Tax=Psychrobacter sp. HD31 TaxID=3112003 RepID=UPI003DA29D76
MISKQSQKVLLKISSLSIAVTSIMLSTQAMADNSPHTTLQTITINADVNNRSKTSQEEVIHDDESTAMQQATHLNNFMHEVPGVDIGGTSTVNQHIYIRGVEDKDLKVTVDGARQENFFFHHAGNLAIDPEFYKAAEVSVGNNSVTLGNNASGGAVAFKTVDAEDLLKPDQTMGARVKVGYHSNDKQVNGNVAVYGKPTDSTDVLLAYGMRNSDGGEDGHGNHIQGDDIEIGNILAKFSFMPTDDHKITLGYKSLTDEGNYPFKPEFSYTSQTPFPGYNNSDEYTLGYAYDANNNFKLDVNAYHTEREYRTQGRRGPRMFDLQFEGKVDGINAQAQNTVELGISNHNFIYGAEAYRKSSTDTADNSTEKATSYGVYLEDQIYLGRFHLTPGVRYDKYKASSQINKDYDQFSGAIAASIDLTKDVSVFASHTQFFKGPPLPETLNNSYADSLIPNANLEPETGTNTELGISVVKNDLLMTNDNLSLVAKGFKTDISDKIESDWNKVNGKWQFGYVNADEDQTVEGYEIAAKYRKDNVVLKASYDHSDTDSNKTRNLRTTGDRLSVGMDYLMQDNLSFGMRWNHVAGIDRLESRWLPNNGDERRFTKRFNNPSYQTVDFYGSYVPNLLPDLKLDFGVYNATNAYYAEHTSYNNSEYPDYDAAEGRNVKVSASYKF